MPLFATGGGASPGMLESSSQCGREVKNVTARSAACQTRDLILWSWVRATHWTTDMGLFWTDLIKGRVGVLYSPWLA